MGGRSTVQNEILCRFIFPERPGALMKFLDALSPRWNISLFHYRGEVGIKNLMLLVNIRIGRIATFFFFFYNLGCPGQLAHTSTNPMRSVHRTLKSFPTWIRVKTNPMGSVHRTLGSFPTRIRVNRWLFTRRCGPKELIAPKRC